MAFVKKRNETIYCTTSFCFDFNFDSYNYIKIQMRLYRSMIDTF